MVSFFNFTYTSWKLQKLDHRSKNLPLPALPKRWLPALSFSDWINASMTGQVMSLTALALVLWAEVFSAHLTRPGLRWDWALSSLFPLVAAFPVNLWLHGRWTGEEKNAFSKAHAFFSALFPLRLVNIFL